MNDIAIIHLRGKQAGFAVIDADMEEAASKFKWFRDKDGYVHSVKGHIELGKLVIQTPIGFSTDHRNRVKIDNRRCNLRPATPTEQNFNQSKRRGKYSSQYKGVCYVNEGVKRWQAAIHINKKKVYLGMFPTEEQAAMCYNDAAYRNFMDFAVLNEIDPQSPAITGKPKETS